MNKKQYEEISKMIETFQKIRGRKTGKVETQYIIMLLYQKTFKESEEILKEFLFFE